MAISCAIGKKPVSRLRLALNWLCFFAVSAHHNLHKPLLLLILRPFNTPANWLCFFKCALSTRFGFRVSSFGFPGKTRRIGFVFSNSPDRKSTGLTIFDLLFTILTSIFFCFDFPPFYLNILSLLILLGIILNLTPKIKDILKKSSLHGVLCSATEATEITGQ